MQKNKKVVIAMSGGIDSSIAAILLKNQGYKCIGIHLKFWNDPTAPIAKTHPENKCCSTESAIAARKICDMLNIPFSVINVSREFKKHIVDYFIDEYCAGRTPNPCVECNRFIKFGELIKIAKSLKTQYIATGHYARIAEKKILGKTVHELKSAKDKIKDQSYFLYTLTQKKLKRVLFPLGNMTKAQVKEIAKHYGLDELSAKKESQNLCFFPDRLYADFLKRYLGKKHLRPGPIMDLSGKRIGEHNGIALCTIGQRKNLGISGQKYPLYVVKIDKKSNTVFVGRESDLYSKKLTVKKLNFINERPRPQTNIKTKIRYKARAVPAKLILKNSTTEVIFRTPQRAAAKGQSAVFYIGGKVIGGGIIA